MVDWHPDQDRVEQQTGVRRAGRSEDTGADARQPLVVGARPGSRPFSAGEIAALQPIVGNAAVSRILAVQRDDLDDAWTTGGIPPANEGAGWSTGGPAPGGGGPVEEPGYGPPGEEPEEPQADGDVELARWISHAGFAFTATGRWYVVGSRMRSGPGIAAGSTSTVNVTGVAGQFGLPDPASFPETGGYTATVAVWSTADEAAFTDQSSDLIRITIGRPLAPEFSGSAAALKAAALKRGGADAPAPTGQLLLRGSVGPAVKDLQGQLGIDADGIFGAGTEQAVRDFQASQGLDVDGIVGPKTHAALDFQATIPATGGA